MNTCEKRSVLGAGDRPARIEKAAAEVQAAANQLAQRVQPHAGAPGGSRGLGAIPHGQLAGGFPFLGGGGNPLLDALRRLGQAMGGFAREVGDTFRDAANNARDRAAASPNAAGVVLGFANLPYTEPMFIHAPNDQLTIAAVMCARAVSINNPAERLLNGSEIDFDFASNNQLKINSIDGMTPDATKPIHWVFIYFGIPKLGIG
jgi:hypothetical protein